MSSLHTRRSGSANESVVLVINAGSSSVKYELIDPTSELALASGIVERVGLGGSHLRHVIAPPDARQPEAQSEPDTETPATASQPEAQSAPDARWSEAQAVSPQAANPATSAPATTRTFEYDVDATDHSQAISRVVEAFATHGPSLSDAGIRAVGHRVVMGGGELHDPVVVTDEVVATIESLAPLAPLHNPANAAAIRIARSLLPDVPHVAVFDTAFFHDLPAPAATYAIPTALAADNSIRRYGFHGISHEYVSRTTATFLHQTMGRDPSLIRQIVLHLGNGASASAVVGGRAVETSMGFTPLEGLVMGTRSGDIDPSIAFYLNRHLGMSVDEIDHILNHQSGLLGLAGSNDMRDVHAAAAEGGEGARLAIEIYAHRLRKYIGAYSAVMGGLDALTFTAGVGENDAVVRAAACDGLGFMGITIDSERNTAATTDTPRLISADGSVVAALVVPTREELSIARQALTLLDRIGR